MSWRRSPTVTSRCSSTSRATATCGLTACCRPSWLGATSRMPAVYLTAARLLALDPGEVMLVAAHPWDLKGARARRAAQRARPPPARVRRGLASSATTRTPTTSVGDLHELAARLSSRGEHDRAAVGDHDRVCLVTRRRTVDAAHVHPSRSARSRPPRREHRLDRDHEAVRQTLVAPRRGPVEDRRLLVHLASDPMSGQLTEDLKSPCLGGSFDHRGADVSQRRPGLSRLDAGRQRGTGRVVQALLAPVHRTDRDRRRPRRRGSRRAPRRRRA